MMSLCLYIFVFILVLLLLSSTSSTWGTFMSNWEFLSFMVVVSYSQTLFLAMLIFVFSIIMPYSEYYMGQDVNYLYYSLMMTVFFMSMVLLLICNSLFLLLTGWDLLGISSFLLVLYNKNWESVNSALNTVMSNRIGDFMLFLGVLVWVPFVSMGVGVWSWNGVFMLALFGAASTKSAQFPFSGWLPKAMAAPTPTSALVHSSTLVTAGVLMMMKFVVPMMSSALMVKMVWAGLLTMTIAGMTALIEEDVKKVVALSTLSQMGLSMSTLGMGYCWLAYLHLISHGFFKSLLFLQIGYMMHSMSSLQDPRMFMALGKGHFYLQVQMKISLLALCGQMFTSGMITKEVILNHYMYGTLSVLMVILFMVSLMLTFLYSYRLWLSLFKGSSVTVFVTQSSFLVKGVSCGLVILSASYMLWLSFNFVIIPPLFVNEGASSTVMLVVIVLGLYSYTKNYKHSLLSSKFTSDYALLEVCKLLFPVKFVEMLHFSFNSKLFVSLKLSTLRLNLYMKGANTTALLFIILLVLFW
uniref:NADH:ubiquinone reductase (H(+)-translocating) n=1 Tax=Acrobeles complexus TaxID=293684 RepID=A0A0H3V2W9_9BILA|nr:NADH dehydrogenase subunit 5 [Acrobeles complexus]